MGVSFLSYDISPIQIVQIEGKDLVLAGEEGYQVKSFKRYKGSLDFSLDWIKLEDIAKKVLRRKKVTFRSGIKNDFKRYTDLVVSVTFNYRTDDMKAGEIREYLYKEGFTLNGKKYVRFKRSSGSARVGKCLFIRKELFKPMMKWSYMGLDFNEDEPVDLASLEAYIALTTSSIIDTIDIHPENILVIDDYESKFEDEVIAVGIDENNKLKAEKKLCSVSNSIWDGQSLADVSLFGDKYQDKGMLLLRNRFFKSCCFNCNIQQFFKDNNITDVSQLNGYTRANSIEDIKIITTPSSIKFVKFGTLDEYFDRVEPMFGIVKYDKPTHYMNGQLVQSHYQLLNTLKFTREEVAEFLEETFYYISRLRTDTATMRYQLKMNIDKEISDGKVNTTNEFIYYMMLINDNIEFTDLYHKFKNEIINNYISNIRAGHVLIHGNYSTLMGNGLEMLKASVGLFDGTSSLGIDKVMSKYFDDGEKILGSRSPHVTMGNIWLMKNSYVPEIDKYFNLSKQIICINSINSNVLERLNGCDFDSDTLLITNNKMLIKKAEENYDRFLVPTTKVESIKTKRYNTAWHKYDLDEKTSVNKIGEIINLSQILNSRLWELDRIGGDTSEIYDDICKLAVLSCIEIDKAKKEFVIDSNLELRDMRLKYKEFTELKPKFFYYLPKDESMKKPIEKYRVYETTMDYLEESIDIARKKTRVKNKNKRISFADLLNSLKTKDRVNISQANRIIEIINHNKQQTSALWADENISKSEKYELNAEMREDCIRQLSEFKVNAATLRYVILECNKSTQRRMFASLYFVYKDEFLNLFKDNMTEIKTLQENDLGDITIYGINFEELMREM